MSQLNKKNSHRKQSITMDDLLEVPEYVTVQRNSDIKMAQYSSCCSQHVVIKAISMTVIASSCSPNFPRRWSLLGSRTLADRRDTAAQPRCLLDCSDWVHQARTETTKTKGPKLQLHALFHKPRTVS